MTPALCLVLMALGAEAGSGEAVAANSGEYVAGMAVGRVREQGLGDRPYLDGYRLAFTAFSRESSSRPGHAGSWYAEWKQSHQQEILEGGVEMSYP